MVVMEKAAATMETASATIQTTSATIQTESATNAPHQRGEAHNDPLLSDRQQAPPPTQPSRSMSRRGKRHHRDPLYAPLFRFRAVHHFASVCRRVCGAHGCASTSGGGPDPSPSLEGIYLRGFLHFIVFFVLGGRGGGG